jgi:ParB family transcriptional regulator, chromosome partitioning protein
MMSDHDPKKRLGRGLAALIGEADRPVEGGVRAAEPDRFVAIELLKANERNPRRSFDADELADLARSIAEHGIVQPILVRPAEAKAGSTATFEIIAGERRWRAAQLARLHQVPVIVREASDREALELAIIENIQRSDLNPVEEATGYRQLMQEHGYSQAELGNTLGKSRSHIANTLRLLKLPEDVLDMLVSGLLSAGHARTLVTSDDPGVLARRIVAEGLSVRQAEALSKVRAAGTPQRKNGKGQEGHKSADILALERELEEQLGLRVDISHRSSGGGTVRIAYRDVEQLDGLCRRIQSVR